MIKNKIDVKLLKTQCPLPDLMRMVGYGQFAKSSCPSPFRQDKNSSWGIFEYKESWYFKDFGTGERGDEIAFLAQINHLDAQDDFVAVLRIYQDIVKGMAVNSIQAPTIEAPVSSCSSTSSTKPDARGFGPGTDEQIEELSKQRGISIEGLSFAQERGVLVFGQLWGLNLYGVRDQTGLLVELRRVDGLLFPAYGHLPERKSHALKGSQKNWPLGIMEAGKCEYVALAEGVPDFLALHQYVVQERAQKRVGPVTMLSSACLIAAEATEHFKGKRVCIYPHSDEAGIKGAARWMKQLTDAGAINVEFFNFSAFHSIEGGVVKDLCEFNQLHMAGKECGERGILP